ncbi:hypothetical protein ACFYW8_34520 [Streptomyces sp. NPDC002742]|uniref:hypothetical protein n=1 Tax=Streptomyces sp. NPDC002742 TaxID=3364663 RepID=UPI003674F9C9
MHQLHGAEPVDWLHEAGIHYIQLHASEAGKSVYEAAGFVTGRYPGMDLITPPPPDDA